MTPQDFKDAYILLLSGDAKIVPNKGIEWKDNFCYITFLDFPDSSKAIINWYYKNGSLRWRSEYKNGRPHGSTYRILREWRYMVGSRIR